MNGKNVYIISLSIVVAGLIIGGAVMLKGGNKADLADVVPQPPVINGQDEPKPVKPVKLETKDYPFIGKDNAPVTIVEVTDFQCPFCARFAKDTFSQLKEKYIDTGKVKFVFRNFPLPFHQDAPKAAEAALCLDKLGIPYVDAHKKIFDNIDALTVENLKTYAKDLGADAKKFAACLDGGEFTEAVTKDKDEIQKAITEANLTDFGTPAFFINGEALIGAQPLSAFEKVIEEKLK